MATYEVMLKYVGKGKTPRFAKIGYGFGMNPPISVRAKNMVSAKKMFELPKTVKIQKIKRVNING
jgi:hypothetical protein